MRYLKKISCIAILGALPLVGFADQGENIYTKGGSQPQALACITCHGAEGHGLPAAGYPNITGMPAAYISKQLFDFQDGARSHAIMDGIAGALSEEEIEAVADYMESLPVAEVPLYTRATMPTDEGSKLALRGEWSKQIPECIACHGPSGVGVGDAFPRLAGQSSAYIVNQINAWKNGTRTNDPADLMGHIARSLTDEQAQAVAIYFETIGQQGE